MGTYEDTAIDAVRDWLMDLLKRREWCQARGIGKALEMLVEGRNRPTPMTSECTQAEQRLR